MTTYEREYTRRLIGRVLTIVSLSIVGLATATLVVIALAQ